ncbi:MAG: BLUF domain-containing protein [Bacteroidota bacterium]
MHSLVYRSVASDSFTRPEIYSMLSRAKDYNAEHGITGCLLYHNAYFLQLLEGDEAKVMDLFERISKDERHHQLTLVESNSINERMFKTWSMAFHDYGQNGLSAPLKLEQINTFLNDTKIYHQKSLPVLKFFSNVKDILFSN